MGSEAQRLWMLGVLGIDVQATARAQLEKQSRLAGALRAWQFARRGAVANLQALQVAFMETGKPLGRYIARGGLRDVLADHLALIDQAVDSLGNASHPKLAKLPAAADGLRTTLGAIKSDTRLGVLERNPFGVTVNFRSQLASAINAMLGAFAEIESNTSPNGNAP